MKNLKSILKISFQIQVIKVRWYLRVQVQNKYESIGNNLCVDKVFTRRRVKYYIVKLNSRSSPGIDGVMTEHLKYATESSNVNHLSSMLTVCLKFGIVPKSFSSGLLVPLLKKPALDPSVPKNCGRSSI